MENDLFCSGTYSYKSPIFYLLTLLFYFVSLGVSAQNLKKYYTSNIQDNGVLYFIHPDSKFANKKLNSEFVYDITYNTKQSTGTFNFSYFDKNQYHLDRIAFFIKDSKYCFEIKKIFIEMRKSKWYYRYSVKIPFEQLKLFYHQENPKIVLYRKNRQAIELIPRNSWKKNSDIVKKIFAIISYNK